MWSPTEGYGEVRRNVSCISFHKTVVKRYNTVALISLPPPQPSQSCSTNGFPPAAAHRCHLAPGPNGGQQQRDALPLPVCRLQLSAGSTADVDLPPAFSTLSDSECFPFDFTGHLHLLLPRDPQQRCEEEPQERLHREENGIRRVQHHKSLFAYSECTFFILLMSPFVY